MKEVIYLDKADFRESLARLRRRGGQHQRAFDEACRIVESLRHNLDVSNKITKNGESRIDHAVKYDVSNDAHRLVTVHSENCIYLLFVGTHDDTEKWIENNRGLKVTASKDNARITVTHVSASPRDQWRQMPEPPLVPDHNLLVNFFGMVEGLDLKSIVPQVIFRKAIESWHQDTDDQEIEEVLAMVEANDPPVATLIFDVVCALREGQIESAQARIDAFNNVAVIVQSDPNLEKQAIASTQNSDQLLALGAMSNEDVARLLNPSEFDKWMLFLHPEQQRIVDADYDRP